MMNLRVKLPEREQRSWSWSTGDLSKHQNNLNKVEDRRECMKTCSHKVKHTFAKEKTHLHTNCISYRKTFHKTGWKHGRSRTKHIEPLYLQLRSQVLTQWNKYAEQGRCQLRKQFFLFSWVACQKIESATPFHSRQLSIFECFSAPTLTAL